MEHRILPFACLLTVVACSNRQGKSISSSSEILTPRVEVDTVTVCNPEPAYPDSISMITGIASGSAYWYDPSWDIMYSAGGDTLRYYPRKREATYFTIPSSVRVIEERAFQCNDNLKEIIIPEGVEEIGLGAFLWSKKLQTVTIRGRIDTLYWRTFDGCPELRSVELPWSVKSIDGMAFINCRKLRRIVIRNPEPPTLEGYEPEEEDGEMSPFAGVDTDRCLLQVPYGSVKKYREAPGWTRFKNIEGNIQPIPHRWVELDSTLLAGYGITPEQVGQWKQYFHREFKFDKWEAANIKYFHNEDRYVVITDLQNLLLFEKDEAVPEAPCALWRLLQYAGKCGRRIPETKVGQARMLRMQIDSVLSYEALSNADMGNKSGLEEYLNRWYYDLLSWQLQSKVSSELAELLKQEDDAWEEYHSLAMKAFYTISDTSGSGFHIWYFGFGKRDMVLRKIGTEGLYTAVFPDARLPHPVGAGRHATVTDEQVLAAYNYVPLLQWDEELIDRGFSTLTQMKKALAADQKGWEQWMAVRSEISVLLSGPEKETWDIITNNIRRQKIELLKNGYNMF